MKSGVSIEPNGEDSGNEETSRPRQATGSTQDEGESMQYECEMRERLAKQDSSNPKEDAYTG